MKEFDYAEIKTLLSPERYRSIMGIDTGGSLIAAVKIDPLKSYAGEYNVNGQYPAQIVVKGVADLLSLFIQSDCLVEPSDSIWDEIKRRIDYTYECLAPVLTPILGGHGGKKGNLIPELTRSGQKVRDEVVDKGRRLFFKLNLVNPEVLSFRGSGKAPLNVYGCPGIGVQACTDWAFLAALMRWFHDNLDISYHQMAVGDSSSSVRICTGLYGWYFPFPLTTESIFEGRLSYFNDTDSGPGLPMYYGGYPFYFVRKYLCDTHSPRHSDNPMNGYLQSQRGIFVPPGSATDILPVYDLGFAEAFTPDARGRVIDFPAGVQYKQLTIHKAIVGDPDDKKNYPGCVLINVPKLKIHSVCSVTHAIKNLGIGLWPAHSGEDSDPTNTDYKYGLPSTICSPGCRFFPAANLMGRVYHSRHSHGIRYNQDGALDPSSVPGDPNDGIKGSMVDINLAVRGLDEFIPYTLHVSDAITVTNMSHGGALNGYSKNEGYIFASEDPVALDLFAARFLFKNVPQGTVPNHPFAMYTPFTDVHFEEDSRTIVSSEGGFEFPVERDALFAYAESRGLGSQRYHVMGLDLTVSKSQRTLLASREGHFGRIVYAGEPRGKDSSSFAEILTQAQAGEGQLPFYTSTEGPLWPLSNTMMAYTKAADLLTKTRKGLSPVYHAKLMSQDTNGNGVLEFSDEASDVDFWMGIISVGFSFTAARQVERANFHNSIKPLKYSERTWNTQGMSRATDSASMTTAMMYAAQPQSSASVDRFFNNMVYGKGSDGAMRWPSLQWTRYRIELGQLAAGFRSAFDYAWNRKYDFTLSVPKFLPYFPLLPHPFMALSCEEIRETDDPNEMFVAVFFDQSGREVERW